VYLEYRGNRMLFDCGEGTQRQMRIAGLPFMKLDRIFISHFHADHCLGIGGLIQTMDLFKRSKKLEIYGPEGIHEVINKIITTGHFVLEGFDLEVVEIKPKGVEQIYKDKDITINSTALDHTVPCLGFSFEQTEKRQFKKKKALALGVPEGPLFSQLQAGEAVKVGKKTIRPEQVLSKAIPGKKITYVPDTYPCKAAVDLSKNSDILIHESTFSEELKDSAKQGMHTTAKEAAKIAKKAKVGKLFLTHISQRYPNSKELEKEAKEVFPKAVVADDFDIVTL